MELTAQNLNYLLALIALVSVFFNIYGKIFSPQSKLEKDQAISKEEAENKAELLAQELRFRNEEYNRRFQELIQGNKDATVTANNHINTVKTQVENLTTMVHSLDKEFRGGILEIKTMINERIPK